MPRGPRRNFRAVPVSRSAPTSVTSTGNWPTAWVASSEVERAGRAGDPADLGGRVDQPAERGHPGQPDQLRPLVDQLGQRGQVDRAVRVVGHHHQLGPGPPGHLQVREHAAAVLGPAGEDAVAGPERDRVEGRVPGVGGVVEQRDLLAPGAEQPGHPGVRGLDPVGDPVECLVPADAGLELELLGHRGQRAARHQCGAGVVEVDAVFRARGLGPQPVDVHPRALPGPAAGHAPTVHNGRSRRVALAPAVRSVMKYRGARPEATFLGFRPGGAGRGCDLVGAGSTDRLPPYIVVP